MTGRLFFPTTATTASLFSLVDLLLSHKVVVKLLTLAQDLYVDLSWRVTFPLKQNAKAGRDCDTNLSRQSHIKTLQFEILVHLVDVNCRLLFNYISLGI